ncbi:alpha/beta hydrolase [Geodermatophilus sp. SYSU D00758]
MAGRTVVLGLLAGCGSAARETGGRDPAALLTASPGGPPETAGREPVAPGTRPLGLTGTRDALVRVPPGTPPGRALPVVVVLHGAGGDAESGLGLLRGPADERGLLLLAPASRGATWDAVRDGYGPDVATVDHALAAVSASVPVDPRRVALAGFSDGASYALGLGLANGGLFRRVVAFSPGFVPPGPTRGTPRVFVSHGTADEVLPVDRTSREIVPDLRADGYDVTYREFPGPHAVPPEVAREAVDWLGWT